MALTDTQIRAADTKEKPYKLYDANNLHIQIEKWTPKIGQPDKCILGSCRQPGSGFIVHAVRRPPVKRLVPSLGIVEGEVPV